MSSSTLPSLFQLEAMSRCLLKKQTFVTSKVSEVGQRKKGLIVALLSSSNFRQKKLSKY
jgi:hypothetical protein